MTDLPIFEFKAKIIELIDKNTVCIITGETGSGKSTQISQYALNWNPKARVIVT